MRANGPAILEAARRMRDSAVFTISLSRTGISWVMEITTRTSPGRRVPAGIVIVVVWSARNWTIGAHVVDRPLRRRRGVR